MMYSENQTSQQQKEGENEKRAQKRDTSTKQKQQLSSSKIHTTTISSSSSMISANSKNIIETLNQDGNHNDQSSSINNRTNQNNSRKSSKSGNKYVEGYMIQDRLGSGSFTSVFRATRAASNFNEKTKNNVVAPPSPFLKSSCEGHIGNEGDNRGSVLSKPPSTVAIKVIQRNSSKLTPKVLTNLEMEISILKTHHHINIVQLYTVHKSPNHFYLFLEYCGGGDLQRLIRSRKTGRLSEPLTRRLMRDLSSGLEFLYRRNLIHRDIKPQNLLLTAPLPPEEQDVDAAKEGFEDEVNECSMEKEQRKPVLFGLKIADFGFARHLSNAKSQMAETLCGSPLYMAPEILQHQRYDAKADLWSTGTVLFEMIAGKPPFHGENHMDLLRNIMRCAVRLPPGVKASNECVNLLRMLLNRNPLKRAGFEEFFEGSRQFVALGCNGAPLASSTHKEAELNDGDLGGGGGSDSVLMHLQEEKQRQKLESVAESDDIMECDSPVTNISSQSARTFAKEDEHAVLLPSPAMSLIRSTARASNDSSSNPTLSMHHHHNTVSMIPNPSPPPLPPTPSALLSPGGKEAAMISPLIQPVQHPSELIQNVPLQHRQNNCIQDNSFPSPLMYNPNQYFSPLAASPPLASHMQAISNDTATVNSIQYTRQAANNVTNNKTASSLQYRRTDIEHTPAASSSSESSFVMVDTSLSGSGCMGIGTTTTRAPTQQQHTYPSHPSSAIPSYATHAVATTTTSQHQQNTPLHRNSIIFQNPFTGAREGGGKGGILASAMSALPFQQSPRPLQGNLSNSLKVNKGSPHLAASMDTFARTIAVSEDIGRRAVNVAHLGDIRSYLAMRVKISSSNNSSIVSASSYCYGSGSISSSASSALSSNHNHNNMEDVIEEDESDATMEEHAVVSDECGSECSSRRHVSGRGGRRHGRPARSLSGRIRRSTISQRPNIIFTGNEDDNEHDGNDEEMPFAVLAVSPRESKLVEPRGNTIRSPNSGPARHNQQEQFVNKPPSLSNTDVATKTHFREALSCYVKSLSLLKSAISGAKTAMDTMSSICPTGSEVANERLPLHDENYRSTLLQRCEASVRWLGDQFQNVLERANAAKSEIDKLNAHLLLLSHKNCGTTSRQQQSQLQNGADEAIDGCSTRPKTQPPSSQSRNQERDDLPIMSAEELIYNHSLACGKDGALKQLLGQNEAARACYRSAGLLAETLLMDPRIGSDDRCTLDGHVRGFTERIREVDCILQKELLFSIKKKEGGKDGRRSNAHIQGAGLVGLIGNRFAAYGYGVENAL